jgi:hypothetical protein
MWVRILSVKQTYYIGVKRMPNDKEQNSANRNSVWSFIEKSKHVLEQRNKLQISEELVESGENLTEAEPDIKEALSSSTSSSPRGS